MSIEIRSLFIIVVFTLFSYSLVYSNELDPEKLRIDSKKICAYMEKGEGGRGDCFNLYLQAGYEGGHEYHEYVLELIDRAKEYCNPWDSPHFPEFYEDFKCNKEMTYFLSEEKVHATEVDPRSLSWDSLLFCAHFRWKNSNDDCFFKLLKFGYKNGNTDIISNLQVIEEAREYCGVKEGEFPQGRTEYRCIRHMYDAIAQKKSLIPLLSKIK